MANSIELNIPADAAERVSKGALLDILKWLVGGEMNVEQAVTAIEHWRAVTAIAPAEKAGDEPAVYRYRSKAERDWIYQDTKLPPTDMAWQDEGIEEQALYATPTPPSAGVAKIQPAIDALTNGQEQADAHGTMVRVSRQALDEVLAFIQSAAQGGGTKGGES